MNSLHRIADKIDSLALRERAIIFGGVLAVLWMVFNALMLGPLLTKQKRLQTQFEETQKRISATQEQVQNMVQNPSTDPDAANRAKLEKLKQEMVLWQSSVQELHRGLVPPGKMAALLEGIVRKNPKVKVIELKTLPAVNLADTSAVKDAAATSTDQGKQVAPTESESIYKHGVQIVLEGEYLELLNYLTVLENSPWQMFWSNADFQVVKYPKAKLTLTLYTLSWDKAWLAA